MQFRCDALRIFEIFLEISTNILDLRSIVYLPMRRYSIGETKTVDELLSLQNMQYHPEILDVLFLGCTACSSILRKTDI